MAIAMIIASFATMVIVISARPWKLMNRLHTGAGISSHKPPSNIAFKTFYVMIVIQDEENIAVHHNENNSCPHKTV